MPQAKGEQGVQILAQADRAPAAANNAPVAAADAVVTAPGAALSVPVLNNDRDPDGDPLTLRSVGAPASGQATPNPDGSITFTADQPGLHSFTYQAGDGQGGSASGTVWAFVNPPGGELAAPVLQDIDDQALAQIARAAAAGFALDVTTLEGPRVTVAPPAPGERVQIVSQPGQQVELQGGAFVGATYFVAEGGLLVITDDGRMVYLSGFVDAARGDAPPRLSVAGGPAVGGDQLLTTLRPISEPATESTVGRIEPPEAGPEHGGGAGFSQYDPGNIGPGLDPLGPQPPTALGLGAPPLLRNVGDTDGGLGGGDDGNGGNGGNGDNARPVLSLTSDISAEVGEVTVSEQFASAVPLPTLAEQTAVPLDLINGVDQRNLTLGSNADAIVTFVDEFAAFQNVLGVYLIGEDGTITAPRIVFAQVEHAEPGSDPFARPGGGPLSPGDEVRLSELYTEGELAPGVRFAFFNISDGFTVNGDLSGADLVFLNPDGGAARIGDTAAPQLFRVEDGTLVPVGGNILHTASGNLDGPPADPLTNPLNSGGRGQVISGLRDGGEGLTLTFEDKILSLDGDTESDNDFNDVTYDVLLAPTTRTSLDFVDLDVVLDPVITDDDANLGGAVAEIRQGFDGDRLVVGPLDDTGITLSPDSTGTQLIFEGVASIDTYLDVLRTIRLDADVEGLRELTFRVEDERGALSDSVGVRVDLSTQFAEIGTDGDDILIGQSEINDAMAGRDGNDTLFGLSGNDILDGGRGNDILIGGLGDDLLIGGPGADELWGNARFQEDPGGADTFLYFSLADRGDRIMDFNALEGDVLDFSELLSGATPDTIEDFVSFTPDAGNIEVSVDADGPGSDFTPIAFLTLVDPTGLTTGEGAAAAAASSGALVV